MLRKFLGMVRRDTERPRKRPRTYKPMLEVLEGRTLLTLPTLQISAPGGVFDGSAYAAAALVAGADGNLGPSLEGVSPGLTYFAGASATGVPLADAPAAPGSIRLLHRFRAAWITTRPAHPRRSSSARPTRPCR